MALVPAMTMAVSSSISTTAIILVILALVVGTVRFPTTLYATFVELSTIKKRAEQKTKEQRQNAEREYALKIRNEMKVEKANDKPSSSDPSL